MDDLRGLLVERSPVPPGATIATIATTEAHATIATDALLITIFHRKKELDILNLLCYDVFNKMGNGFSEDEENDPHSLKTEYRDDGKRRAFTGAQSTKPYKGGLHHVRE